MKAMPTKESMIARAQAIEITQPAEAAQIYTEVLALDAANLTAHNQLEALHAPQRYRHWMRVNCVIDEPADIFRFFAIQRFAKNPIRK